MKREKTVLTVCSFAVGVNFVLFLVKLYVSLSSNSISIFSDSINNLSDSLSCLLVVFSVSFAFKFAKQGISYIAGKVEQLLSFLLAIVVGIIGFSFAYSSVERLMYPTPVWFTYKYFAVISATALVKLGMFFVFGFYSKKTSSPIIKVMKADSITDFAVTCVTLVSFTLTQYTEFTVDAFAGLIISAVIIIQALKLIKDNLLSLLNVVKKEKREAFFEAVYETVGENVSKVKFSVDGEDEVSAYVFLKKSTVSDFEAVTEKIQKNCFEKTKINTYVIIGQDDEYKENKNNER